MEECGNNVCGNSETCENCPADCTEEPPPTEVTPPASASSLPLFVAIYYHVEPNPQLFEAIEPGYYEAVSLTLRQMSASLAETGVHATFCFAWLYNDLTYCRNHDRQSGEIANRRVFVRVPQGEGGPDGMTVDADGYVWGARWGGSCIVRYTPQGIEEQRVTFPALKVSSVTFGGPDYTDIYVTTAGGDDKEHEGQGAGALFRLNLGIQGVPEFRSRIAL